MKMCLLLKSLMEKLCILSILFCFSFHPMQAQQTNSTIQSFLNENQKSFGLTEKDVVGWTVTSQYQDERNGVQQVYIQQQHFKIPVFNAIAPIVIRNGKAYGLKPPFVHDLANKVNSAQPSISPQQAIQAALTHLELPSTTINSPTKIENENKKFIYSLPSIASSPVKVELVYVPTAKGVKLAWDVSIELKGGQHWWNVRIDAANGSYLEKNDWVVSCNWDAPHDHAIHSSNQSPEPSPQPLPLPGTGTAQYNVFELPVESPIHGSRALLNDPSDLIASPYGWHDTNGSTGVEYNITRGNNVYAYEDANNDDLPGYSPDGGALQHFNFPFHIDSSVTYNRDASLSNLFYMNNMLHDLLYQNGFNEAQGNFQSNNYGNGGLGSDYVLAEGLDGGGTNNANFGTPNDGSLPRMQMYLWSGTAPSNCVTFNVNTPPAIAGLKSIATASYNPTQAFNITAEMVLAIDGVGTTSDGCETFTNSAAVAGKIVLVDRGNCSFYIKTQNAQLAGASAIVIADNVSSSTPPPMSGTPTISIYIPTVSVTMSNGNAIKAQLGAGVSATLIICSTPPPRDGSFDNGIVAHEYGHGVSNRLTGGPGASSCLQNAEQGGEGWSDWLGLITTIEPGDSGAMGRGIGTFALFQPTTGLGIRRYRYSTNMSINPQTYADLATSSSAHPRGEIWCDAIWDMTWFLIRDFGFDPNLYTGTAGNNVALNLVLKGMALQPCSPGYIDARNAILLADDIYYGSAHRCQIWEAFARRGMGYYASQGSSNAVGDETVDFTYPPFCLTPTAPPVAAFTSNQTTALCPASIQFTDVSTSTPQSWFWNFGDGQTSTQQNPAHVYSQAGTYSVKLKVTNTLGSDSLVQTNFITITTFSLTTLATPNVVCAGDSVQLNVSVSGSTAISGYSVSSITYAPTTGSGTTVALTDDVVSGVLPIGFDFNFYGNVYSNFYISSNGFIGFSSGMANGCCQGQLIPSASDPNNLIAFAWNDLNPGVNASVVSYFTTGTAPNRKLVVKFNTNHYNGTAYPMIGQIELLEGSNIVEIHSEVITSVGGSNVTTQGVENISGTNAMTPSGRNASLFAASMDAYQFIPYSNFNYAWTPSSNMNNATLSNPKAAPTSTTNFNVMVTDPNGCVSTQTINVLVNVCGPGAGLNLRAFIEGLKTGPGVMTPVLFNTGESTNPLDCDTISIELHQATTPYATVYAVPALLNINGYASANFPVGALGNSYYLVVRTRNGIETWSKLPVLMGASTVFDLTTP